MVYLGFDFGYKRIGVAVGQSITKTAQPLITVSAKEGVPDWHQVDVLVKQWRPEALVVGYPTNVDGTKQYTSKAAKRFATALQKRFECVVHLVDERMTTVEARSQLFESGGYRRIQKTAVDSIAACIILEQYLIELA